MVKISSILPRDRLPLPDFRLDFFSFRADFFDHFRFFFDARCVNRDVSVNSVALDVVDAYVTIMVVVVVTSGVVDKEVGVVVVGGALSGTTIFGDFFGFNDNSFFSFRGKISSNVNSLWYFSLSSQN